MISSSAGRLWLLALLLLVRPVASAAAPDPAVFAITLNQEVVGNYTVFMGADGDIFVRRADLVAMGFRDPAGETVIVEGEACLSLRSMRKVAFRVNEKTVSLKIAASPRLLQRQVIDLVSRGDREVERRTDSSFFVNYGLDYRQNDSGLRQWSLTGEAGAHVGGLLLISDGKYLDRGDEREFVRLMSRLVYDRRPELQRLTVGDFAASTGDLGGRIIVGGVGFEKNYRLDPYFIRNPVFGVSGVTALPAEVEISVDGVVLRREKISPGEFDIRNLWATGGARSVDVKIKDIFGGEIRLGNGFFFTESLLRQGVPEYGYHLGFLREQYGTRSNEYGDPVFSAHHRIGVSDELTAGLAAEGGGGLLNGGVDLAFPLWGLGVVTATARGSRADGESGSAGRLTYAFQKRGFSVRLGLRGQSRAYTVLGQSAAEERLRRQFEAAAGYSLGRRGSFSAGYSAEERTGGDTSRTAALSYSRDLPWSLSLTAALRQVREQDVVNEVYLALSWSGGRTRVTGRYAREEGDATMALEASMNPPQGEGAGYRAVVQNTGERSSANLDLQYNGRYGVYRAAAEGAVEGGDRSGSFEVATAGSFATLGGSLEVGRPIRDAFGIAEVGGIPGVRVLRNGNEIGRTGDDGRLFLPGLDAYYDNEISIADKDIPMAYTIAELKKFVSPAFRQGLALSFDVRRFQALSGFLLVGTKKGLRPLEESGGTIAVGAKEIAFPTGKGGEFYLENVPPGSYVAVLPFEEQEARCAIVVPQSEEVVVELGKITCELR